MPPTCGSRWPRSSCSALFDFRRWLRIAHLDLLVLLCFGISEIYFNAGNIGVSVPLAYPPLVYLLARMIWIGFRGAGAGTSPLGADRLARDRRRVPARLSDRAQHRGLGRDRRRLRRGDRRRPHHPRPGRSGANFPTDNPFGDTYGPFNYYAYVPFELALPWSGQWDNLPAAHAAAIFFDLATVAGLFVLGRRLRPGRDGAQARASSSPSRGRPTRSPITRSSRTRTTPSSRPCSSGRWSCSPRPCGAACCWRSRWPPSSRRCRSCPCSRPAYGAASSAEPGARSPGRPTARRVGPRSRRLRLC